MKKGRVFLRITGQVQGVSFRYYTQEKARKLKLKGWVKNEIDGTVIIEAEGDIKMLEKLINWTRQGPRFAQVKNVDVQWKEFKGELEEFEVGF